MTEKEKEQEDALSLQDMKDFAGQWSEFFSGLQQVLAENELLRQQVQEMKEKDVKREALLQEEKERNTKLEMQLTEMSKMTASVAGKASQEEVLKALRQGLLPDGNRQQGTEDSSGRRYHSGALKQTGRAISLSLFFMLFPFALHWRHRLFPFALHWRHQSVPFARQAFHRLFPTRRKNMPAVRRRRCRRGWAGRG